MIRDWASLVPIGLNEQEPNHYLEMLRVAWHNRDELPYAWRILRDGVCDGCALGTSGLTTGSWAARDAVFISSEDANRLGVADGGRIRLSSPFGSYVGSMEPDYNAVASVEIPRSDPMIRIDSRG